MKAVLVAEDEPALAGALALKFAKTYTGKYHVIEARNGKEALKSEKDADVILLDLLMPKMNGAEFLKERKGTAPVIILSNITELEAQLEFKLSEDQYVAYFVKADTPIHDIVDKVTEVLNDSK